MNLKLIIRGRGWLIRNKSIETNIPVWIFVYERTVKASQRDLRFPIPELKSKI